MIARSILILLAMSSACIGKLPEEMLESFRDYLTNNSQVALVCVFEQEIQERVPPEKHRLYRTATVVRGIRGKWKIGDKIRFYSLLEAIPKEHQMDDGALKFIFLKEIPVGEVFLDTGDVWPYEPELDAVAQDK